MITIYIYIYLSPPKTPLSPWFFAHAPEGLELGGEALDDGRVFGDKHKLVVSVIGVVGEVGASGKELLTVHQDELAVHGACPNPDSLDLDPFFPQELVL